jgi:hypothetical protein
MFKRDYPPPPAVTPFGQSESVFGSTGPFLHWVIAGTLIAAFIPTVLP